MVASRRTCNKMHSVLSVCRMSVLRLYCSAGVE